MGDYSGQTADIIDKEVKDLVNRAYRRAKDLMQTNIGILHEVAEKLIEKENMDGDELRRSSLPAVPPSTPRMTSHPSRSHTRTKAGCKPASQQGDEGTEERHALCLIVT